MIVLLQKENLNDKVKWCTCFGISLTSVTLISSGKTELNLIGVNLMTNKRWFMNVILVTILMIVMLPMSNHEPIHAQDEDGCGDGDIDDDEWVNSILSYDPETDDRLDELKDRLDALIEEAFEETDIPYNDFPYTEIQETGPYYFRLIRDSAEIRLPPGIQFSDDVCIGLANLSSGLDGDNLYSGPGTDYPVVGQFGIPTDGYSHFAVILGRNAAGNWLLVQSNGVRAWIQTTLLYFECNLDSIPIYEEEDTPDARQSLYFRSTPDPTCSEAPHGMFAYYSGEEPASMTINDYGVNLSGSVFISTPTEDTMTFQKLDGEVSIIDAAFNETLLDDSLFTVDIDPIPLESAVIPLSQPDPDTAPVLAFVLQTLFSQPTVFASVDLLADESDDVFACDTDTLATDLKVDINQAAITWFLNDDISVDVQMGEPLGDDFSFGLNTFFLDEDGNPIIAFQWWRHDGEIGEGAWIWDVVEDGFVELSGVSKEYDFETGILHFELSNSEVELRADFETPTIAGVAFESSHTSTSDTQPQPTTCDNSYVPINPREFRIMRLR